MKNTLYIIRGLPGSGKSTLAKRLLELGSADSHYEADMFFEKDGKYQYDRTKIRDAHEWCQKKVFSDLLKGKTVVVSNTFTTLAEMKPYLDFCRKHNIECPVLRLNRNYGNIHDVPADVIAKMSRRFEKYNGEFVEEDVDNDSPSVEKMGDVENGI